MKKSCGYMQAFTVYSVNFICLIFFKRHNIFAIPVTNCNYRYKDNSYRYQVFGLDLQVNAPDYPVKCCCAIL